MQSSDKLPSRDSIDRAAMVFGPRWRADFDRLLGHVGRGPQHDELNGHLLSHYLTQQSWQQLRFFKEFFAAALRNDAVNEFAEVGVGTGLYSRVLLEELPAARGTGFDTRREAIDFARRHVASYGLDARYDVLLRDLVAEPMPYAFQSVVCVDVLSQTQDAAELLKALKALAAPDARLFVTATLNAPRADHVHLYRHPADMLALVREAGLRVENLFVAHADPGEYPEARTGEMAPSSLAMVLAHNTTAA